MKMRRVKTKHYTKNYNVYFVGDAYYLKSYNSWVAKFCPSGGLFLGKDWEWGNSTKRHILWFLKEIVGASTINIPRLREYVRQGVVHITECSPDDDFSIYKIE